MTGAVPLSRAFAFNSWNFWSASWLRAIFAASCFCSSIAAATSDAMDLSCDAAVECGFQVGIKSMNKADEQKESASKSGISCFRIWLPLICTGQFSSHLVIARLAGANYNAVEQNYSDESAPRAVASVLHQG